MDRYRGEKISEGIAFGKIVFFDGESFPSRYEAISDDVVLVAVDIYIR